MTHCLDMVDIVQTQNTLMSENVVDLTQKGIITDHFKF
jgi:hypothetical protein